jgi:DHA1 family tetracycline resistance protein-like MFS transporter
MFLNWLAHGVYPAVWAIVTSYRYDWSEGQIGFSLAVYGIGAAVAMGLVLPRLVPVLGEWKTAVLGMVFSGLGLIGYAFSWHGWMVYAVIVLTVIENVADAPLRSIAASKVPPSAQGELQGVLGSLTSITAIIGPVLFPYLFQYYTAPTAPVVFAGAPFIMSAILVVAGLVVLVAKVRKTEPKAVSQSQAGEAA